jgi:hypothetical protein
VLGVWKQDGELWVDMKIYETRLTNPDIYDRLKDLTPNEFIFDSAEPKSKVRVFGKRSEPTTPVDSAVSPIKRDLNLKPLSSLNKVRQGMVSPKVKAMGKGAAVLGAVGAAGSYAYNKFRTPDLGDYAPEDQAYIKEMLPVIKGYYNNVDKFKTDLDRDQQLQVVDYVNTLKKLPALKADFPQNTNWDIYVKTID